MKEPTPMPRKLWMITLLAGWWLLPMPAPAFNDPVDIVGSLTVRLEGPALVTQVDKPYAVTVVLENGADAAVEGAVRLAVIDGWTTEPAKPVPFAVKGKQSARVPFQVRVAKGAFNALYPIHAFAEIKVQDRSQTAHPVLIVETKLAQPPQPAVAIDWQPVPVPKTGGLAIGRLTQKRVVVQPFDGQPQTMPVGWTGSEPQTRASVVTGQRIERGESREAIGIHPPWASGKTGTAWIEFPLQLPQASPIRLAFATAIRTHAADRGEPASDGVTFRVRVAPFDAPAGQAGEVLFERHSDAKVWQPAEVDLAKFAGQKIRLQLESDPGPKRNTTCDQSYWAEPIVLVGTPAQEPAFPPAAQAPSQLLGVVKHEGGTQEVRLWPGQRGLLDATVGFVSGQRRLLFHGLHVRAGDDDLRDRYSVSSLQGTVDEASEGGRRVRHQFSGPAGAFDLLIELKVEHDTGLQCRVWLERAPKPKPWSVVYLQDVSLGSWSAKARKIYAGPGNVLQDPEAFRLSFDGHRCSTSFVGFEFTDGPALLQAVNVPPDQLVVDPKAGLYTLHTPHQQTITLIPASNVWQAVKRYRQVNGLKPAAGVQKLAGRFVFDLWGGRYAESSEALRRSFQYGLTDSVVVWHNWQRWGYDYRLPDILPANPSLGTVEEFDQLAKACKAHGVLFAPHDNYIDFYPDAQGYSYDHIAFTQDRRPVRAWLNRGRKAQSYRWRPDRLRPFLERNLRQLRAAHSPTAYFIDVWSSARPYDCWTSDGQFIDRLQTRRVWGEAFAWIRELLGKDAPQISESGHDQLIGWLDGAQTNHLRVDVPPPGRYSWSVWDIKCADAQRVPWFDAAHHDRFILHGAGYQSRYAAGLEPSLHGIYSDDYITTEVLTGHPAMVPAPFGRDVVRKYWLLHDLMRALALRQIEEVVFHEGNLHRQLVRWSGGGQVWVNRGTDDWTVEEHVLPPYGFLARVPSKEGNVEAAIERREEVIVDWARGPSGYYVNARPVIQNRWPVRPSLESIRLVDGRKLQLSLQWEAERSLPLPLSVFIHFVDEKGEILFQASQKSGEPTTEWLDTVQNAGHSSDSRHDPCRPESRVARRAVRPAERHPGPPLLGVDDGSHRIRLGTLQTVGEQAKIKSVVWKPLEEGPDPVLARLNPEGVPIPFDAVTSDGACRLTWRRPGSPADAVCLIVPDAPSGSAGKSCPWDLPTPRQIEAISEDGETIERRTVRTVYEGVVAVHCKKGVYAYRLTPQRQWTMIALIFPERMLSARHATSQH